MESGVSEKIGMETSGEVATGSEKRWAGRLGLFESKHGWNGIGVEMWRNRVGMGCKRIGRWWDRVGMRGSKWGMWDSGGGMRGSTVGEWCNMVGMWDSKVGRLFGWGEGRMMLGRGWAENVQVFVGGNVRSVLVAPATSMPLFTTSSLTAFECSGVISS